jgi:fucose permease
MQQYVCFITHQIRHMLDNLRHITTLTTLSASIIDVVHFQGYEILGCSHGRGQ